MWDIFSLEYGGDAKQHEIYRRSIDFWAKVYTWTVLMCHIFFMLLVVYCTGKWFVIFPLLNAILGVLILEWAWYNTQRIHNVDEERDACFPEFRRLDARFWNKWLHYPLAMTIAIPTLYMGAFIILVTAPVSKFIWLSGYK